MRLALSSAICLAPFVELSFGFAPTTRSARTRTAKQTNQRHICSPLQSAVDDNSQQQQGPGQTMLEGVSTFEEWFKSATASTSKGNETPKFVRHNMFSNGRGLEFLGSKGDTEDNKAIITLPKELILQSTMVDDKSTLDNLAEDWDASLAIQLLRECKLGSKSPLYGYCSLLMQGQELDASGKAPPSTAPNALRNWSDEQKAYLKTSTSKRGDKMLKVEAKQRGEWLEKYKGLAPSDRRGFSEEQFFWALEAVNSRAFKGNFLGQDAMKELSKTLVPFAAAAFALNYIRSDPFGADENLTLLLLVVSCAPVLLNFVSENFGGNKMDAVLLPFIDSANHMETANSNIEFDPLQSCFTVSVEGRNCIVKDGDKQQFYISYGTKRMPELLLNYGFLPGVTGEGMSQDETRRSIAEAFHSRGT